MAIKHNPTDDPMSTLPQDSLKALNASELGNHVSAESINVSQFPLLKQGQISQGWKCVPDPQDKVRFINISGRNLICLLAFAMAVLTAIVVVMWNGNMHESQPGLILFMITTSNLGIVLIVIFLLFTFSTSKIHEIAVCLSTIGEALRVTKAYGNGSKLYNNPNILGFVLNLDSVSDIPSSKDDSSYCDLLVHTSQRELIHIMRHRLVCENAAVPKKACKNDYNIILIACMLARQMNKPIFIRGPVREDLRQGYLGSETFNHYWNILKEIAERPVPVKPVVKTTINTPRIGVCISRSCWGDDDSPSGYTVCFVIWDAKGKPDNWFEENKEYIVDRLHSRHYESRFSGAIELHEINFRHSHISNDNIPISDDKLIQIAVSELQEPYDFNNEPQNWKSIQKDSLSDEYPVTHYQTAFFQTLADKLVVTVGTLSLDWESESDTDNEWGRLTDADPYSKMTGSQFELFYTNADPYLEITVPKNEFEVEYGKIFNHRLDSEGENWYIKDAISSVLERSFPEGFYVGQIPLKYKYNISEKYNIDPCDIVAYIVESKEAGIAFSRKRMVWGDGLSSECSSLDYSDLLDAEITAGWSKLKINNKGHMIEIAPGSLTSEALKAVIESIVDFWRLRKCDELS